ncbi:MAG TPA: dihydroorotase [Thermodesulfovibrionia bacterium]|nr:dihydroorotase [Thermodesulfovibrionia bacterium]
MKLYIKGGRIIDPGMQVDGIYDLLIVDKKIAGIYTCDSGPQGNREIHADGKLVFPGLVDGHTHLREPGYTHKETIRTGTMAGVRGGFTTLCCMANTNPVNDCMIVTDFILKKAEQEGACTVYPIGAVTKGLEGSELAPIGKLKEAGCIAFSDDGMPIMNSLVFRRALEYAKNFDVPIISHCEDIQLSDGGVMNEGFISTSLGLKGVPSASEEIMVARDMIITDYVSGRLHLAHISTKGSVELIRQAKQRGVKVTAETCPHYFSLTDAEATEYRTFAKVNPPLRTTDDIAAIKEGLRDGTIDIIATDHAPHHIDDKTAEFDNSPSGISGLETALSVGLSLVDEGVLSLNQLVDKMACKPALIFNLSWKGTLKEGADADVVIVDTEKEFVVDTKTFLSMGKNTPFIGRKLTGRATVTISMGRVYEWE